MKGICGYGRYNDDPQHVGCPRAKSDMTPCIARDGHVALADPEDPLGETCIGCNGDPWELLVEIKAAAKMSPPASSQGPAHYADQLQKIVRHQTEPS